MTGDLKTAELSGRACIIRYQPSSDAAGRREAEALARAGFDVTLICLGKRGEPRHDAINDVKVRRFRVPKQRGGIGAYLVDYSMWFLACFAWLTFHHLRRPFSVIQVSSLPDFQVFTTIVPKLMGATVVLFLKEPASELVEATDGHPALARIMRRVTAAAIKFADVTLTVTREHRELYTSSGADEERVVVIENTPPEEYVGVARSDRRESERFVALCHGMVAQRYGHDTIIDAAAILRDRGRPMSIVLTGTGPWSEELERRISDAGLDTLVDYRGFVSVEELSGLLAETSVGIVAQHRSPYSEVVHTNKMFECMALGIPVVATRLSSTAAYFEGAIEFFEPGDAVDLADALERVRNDEQRRDELVANADRIYRTLAWPVLERKYIGAVTAAMSA